MKHALVLLVLSWCYGWCFAAEVPGASLADAGREMDPISADVLGVVSALETSYDNHPGFKHYMWEHMAEGSYDLEFLKKYALHYYEHVRVFRLYLAGAMTSVPIEGLQVKLAEIIADEFGVRLWDEPDVDGHPELFRRFMRSLNLTEQDWEPVSTGKNMIPGIDHYRRTHYSMFNELPEEIVGAIIFGMERTTPHRHSSVLAGLEKFTARTRHAVDAQFFSEHVAVDDYHNHALIEPIQDWFVDPVRVQRMKQGALRSFDARKEFLDNLASVLGVPAPAPHPPPTSTAPTTSTSTSSSDPTTSANYVGGCAAPTINLETTSVEWVRVGELKPHEMVDVSRANALLDFMGNSSSTAPSSIPALIVDRSTMVVVDGHHRLSALVRGGYKQAPCILVDYMSLDSDIVLMETAGVGAAAAPIATKDDVIYAGVSGKLLPPKSTAHMILSTGSPLAVMSPAVSIPK